MKNSLISHLRQPILEFRFSVENSRKFRMIKAQLDRHALCVPEKTWVDQNPLGGAIE